MALLFFSIIVLFGALPLLVTFACIGRLSTRSWLRLRAATCVSVMLAVTVGLVVVWNNDGRRGTIFGLLLLAGFLFSGIRTLLNILRDLRSLPPA